MHPTILLCGIQPASRSSHPPEEDYLFASSLHELWTLLTPHVTLVCILDTLLLDVMDAFFERLHTLPDTPPAIVLFSRNDHVARVHDATQRGARLLLAHPLSEQGKETLQRWSTATPPDRVSPAPSSLQGLRAMFTQRYEKANFITCSASMQELLSLASRAARSDATVLIQGESGTGKERIASYIHRESPRASRPFIAINCKALSETLLESELFGHKKGSFTGAQHDKKGLFEHAQEGTLFLDEIGETSLSFQSKLLRVLQEQEIVPIGDHRPVKLNVRILAATHRDLEEEVKQGSFREDLFYRLCVIPLLVPPLRERKDEVLPLTRHFIERNNHKLQRQITGWSKEVEEHLLRHDWPGNVRELENLIERACVLTMHDTLTREDLLLKTPSQKKSYRLDQALERATKQHLQSVLQASDNSKKKAAQLLGVERTTLYRLMKKHNL